MAADNANIDQPGIYRFRLINIFLAKLTVMLVVANGIFGVSPGMAEPASTSPAITTESTDSIPAVRTKLPREFIENIKAYRIISSDGRPPSAEYKQEMSKKAAKWLTKLGSENWQVEYLGLKAAVSESPYAPLPQYIRVSGPGLGITIGLDNSINADMTAQEVQNLINFVANSGFPIEELDNDHWYVQASTPSSHIERGFRVTEFGDGKMTLMISTDFFAVYGQDKRVVPDPDAYTPEFAYFQNRQSFRGDISLKISFDELQSVDAPADDPTWRKIGHEAWGRASAKSLFDLFSVYAESHLEKAEGQPVINFRAHKTTNVPTKFAGSDMVQAAITIFGLPDDSLKAQRWTGLARFGDGTWYLEELWLSQKCQRGLANDRWTSLPCN